MIQIFLDIAVMALRILLPIYAVTVVYLCYNSMRQQRRDTRPLIALEDVITGKVYPVLFWENSIGRARGSDIFIDDERVSREHCVLLRRENGWFISDTNSKSGTMVNGKEVEYRQRLLIDDKITIGDTTLALKRCSDYNIIDRKKSWFYKSERSKITLKPYKLMILITVFLMLMSVTACFTTEVTDYVPVKICGIYVAICWVFFFVSTVIIRRRNFELEALALLLSGIGINLLVRQSERQAIVQMIACVIGIIGFLVIIWFMSDPDRSNRFRTLIMVGAVGLLAINLVFGTTQYGSTNWIQIGSLTVQPSEFVKIAFIIVGASALDKLQTNTNLLQFIIFSAICVGALALMGDFGTALIFFATFLLMAFMRSGDFKTVILAVVSAVFAGAIVLKFKPYVASRFSSWGHVWEFAQEGTYQQARVLTYSASGGLFGVGVGNGCLKHIFASESDLVFGIVSEEMGIIVALAVVAGIVGLVFYARAITTLSRSTAYSISACCAAGLLVIQTGLNVFGATDILPLTGVTLPFISLGGSSIISCWGLLALIKSADERTYNNRKKGGVS